MGQYLYLLAGLALLLVGGEFLVRGGVSLAGHLKISALVVGVTVVSFGTSAPELFVSINANLSGHPDLSLGNVIGSNISNIALVLALTVIIAPYFVRTKEVIRDWTVMFLVSILLIIFLYSDSELSRIEGMIMVLILLFFIFWLLRHSRNQLKDGKGKPPKIKYSVLVSVGLILISSLALVFGSELLVRGASSIAKSFGVSERVISISVIALGTSLPELATSAMAAARKQSDISIGNIIGSNIFNVLAILGITASIKLIPVESKEILSFDIWCMLAFSALLLLLILPLKGTVLTRWKGVILLVSYIVFLYFVYL